MNTFGRIFRVTTFGESHGPTIGTVIDGVRPGVCLSPDDFSEDIARRSPGAKGTTARREEDVPTILSGLLEGRTTGAPLCITFPNRDVRPQDYEALTDIPRPGHADRTLQQKWQGLCDLRGGGTSSGRLTLPVVAAGVVAKKMLEGVTFDARLAELGGCGNIHKWPALLDAADAEGDSLGGVVECTVCGTPGGANIGSTFIPGLGEPFWDSVESEIAHAIFSIPGVRGIEFGDGFRAAGMKGSEHNDPFGPDGPLTNGAGGAAGGISTGAPLYFRVAFKPTSSISKPQRTWNFRTQQTDTLEVKGRHDVCFAQRCPVIVEAMAAIVLADLLSIQLSR